MSKLQLLDAVTVVELLKEATVNFRKAEKLFKKYDNHEDMRESDTWSDVMSWLKFKLENECYK